ncbi:MAG: hypothetical protein AAGC68_04035, partial [Verrucomicrobiota bacterium]
MKSLSENIWFQHFPLRIMGMKLGRTTTVIRLESGRTIIHSTGPFEGIHISSIKDLGDPGWLVEATNFHDTFAKAGRESFPDLPYLVPDGFPGADDLRAIPLEAPPEWVGEVEVIPLRGMPKINEHFLLHRPSRTLIVADLVFNLPPETDWWTRNLLGLLSGMKKYPGNSR